MLSMLALLNCSVSAFRHPEVIIWTEISQKQNQFGRWFRRLSWMRELETLLLTVWPGSGVRPGSWNSWPIMQSQAGVDTGHRGEDRGPGATQRPRHRADQHLLCHRVLSAHNYECSYIEILCLKAKTKFHDHREKGTNWKGDPGRDEMSLHNLSIGPFLYW